MIKSDIVSKDEVYRVIDQYYAIVTEFMGKSPVDCAIKHELGYFCDLIKRQVYCMEGKPFELNYSEDYYIRHTEPKKEDCQW